MNTRTAFALFLTGLICSLAGCTKPVVVGGRYVLSATALAISDDAMILNNTSDDKDFENKYRHLQDIDAVDFLFVGTVIRVLRVHDGKAGRFVFVEVVHEPAESDVIITRGHRYWVEEGQELFKRIDEWYPGKPSTYAYY